MPTKFYEPPTDDEERPKRFCDGLRHDLKYCLMNSDCVQKVWFPVSKAICAEPKVVKFCTHVGYINSSNRITHHPQKGRGYGHVTVLKFCRSSWWSASRGFVSDS